MRRFIAQLFCLLYLVYHAGGVNSNDKRGPIDPALYASVIGSWQDSLSTKETCDSGIINCSFSLEFLGDYTFEMHVGVGCFKQTVRPCSARGNVIAVTADTITVSYACPGCFCDQTNSTYLEYCYRYTKPTPVSLDIAMHRSPASLFSTCPAVTEVGCIVNANNQTESIAVAYSNCRSGDCKVCDSITNCTNRGVCNSQGGCDCFSSFSGPSCNISACTNSCSGHGICDMSKTKILMGMSFFDEDRDVGVCRCFSGWNGPSCASKDIFSGRQKLWEGLIFVGIVSTVTASSILLRRFIYPPFRQRARRNRHRRHRNRVEVELEEFINPM